MIPEKEILRFQNQLVFAAAAAAAGDGGGREMASAEVEV